MIEERAAPDPHDARRAREAPGLLRAFNDAGVLAAADVHVARRIAGLGGAAGPEVALAIALAVRGPRLGHVYVDLATIRATAAVETEEPVDLSALPWPAPDAWAAALRASGLAALGEDDPATDRPLRLVGTHLYLDRYWREERRLADDLRGFSGALADGVRDDVLRDGLDRLLAAGDDGGQRRAGEAAVRRRFAVVAGGPGTGKTTTVARIVALLAEQAAAAGAAAPLIALAAPTGKAAARLEEAVHGEAARLDTTAPVRDQLLALSGSTLHRLLGWQPGSHSRFRHHRGNRLPHDVVIVDETSMVSLSLMARLVEAVRPEARLILVGDPGQLTSIEAGAVLGDIVGPGTADGIVVLDRVHRYGEGIAALAAALRRGDADAVVAVLAAAPEGVTWLPVDVADPDADDMLAPVRDGAVAAARAVIAAARGRRRRGRARRPGGVPRAVRPPPRRARRRDLDDAGRGLAGSGGGRLRRGRPVVRGAAAARDGERLRAAALQRRHRGRRRHGRPAGSARCSSAAASCSRSAPPGSARSTRPTR